MPGQVFLLSSAIDIPPIYASYRQLNHSLYSHLCPDAQSNFSRTCKGVQVYTEGIPKYSENILRCPALRISDIVDGDISKILERSRRLILLGYS